MAALLEVERDPRLATGRSRRCTASRCTVEDGEVVTLIGSNGAGKSTTLRSISGLTPASGGKITFDGEEITRAPRRRSSPAGSPLSPEGRHVFPRMTVRENLDLGAHRRRGPEIAEDIERVFELFPRLPERQKQKAGTMSGGEQQMLAIGRALMARPRLLMLDEPSMGLAPILVQRIYETIARDQQDRGRDPAGRAERQLRARRLASAATCSRPGRVALSDDSERLRDNPEVQRAYLGA